jgi:molecular chaperone GrpE
MMYNRTHMDNEKEAITPSPAGPGGGVEEGKLPGDTPPLPVAELPTDLAAALEKLRAERDALYDRLLRKQAELENFRKRAQREKDDFLQHAAAELIRALLPTLDGFERALQHRNADVPDQFFQGITLIHKELMDVLTRAGLTPIETVGKTFDPHLHQAVETVEAGEHRDQEIVEELQRGYKLRQRLLRPAIVKVAVAPRAAATSTPSGGAEPRDDLK